MASLPSDLHNLTLNLYDNKLGLNVENMNHIGQAMKKLPKNLKNFTLYLCNNNLGDKVENMKNLAE